MRLAVSFLLALAIVGGLLFAAWASAATAYGAGWSGDIGCNNYTTWIVSNDHLVLTCPHNDANALPVGGYTTIKVGNFVKSCVLARFYHLNGDLYVTCYGSAPPVGGREFQPGRTGNPLAAYWVPMPATP